MISMNVKKSAFTLVEVMVSITLLSVVMTYVVLVFNQGNRSNVVSNERIDMLESGRNAMATIMRDVRMSNVDIVGAELDVNGETLTIGFATYTLNLNSEPTTLIRNGPLYGTPDVITNVVGNNIEAVRLAIDDQIVHIDIDVNSNSDIIANDESTLFSSVRRRN